MAIRKTRYRKNRLYLNSNHRAPTRIYRRKATYRSKKKYAGLRKWKRGQRKPKTAYRYFKIPLKGTYIVRASGNQGSGAGPVKEFWMQFRRFGPATLNLPGSNTIGFNMCNKAVEVCKLFRDCAFMGLSVQMNPLVRRQTVQAQEFHVNAGENAKPIDPQFTANYTWYDTDIMEVAGSGQQFNPSDVPEAAITMRTTCQRHKPTAGWKKYVSNRKFARDRALQWFRVKDFGLALNTCPTIGLNPPPNPVFRHHMKMDPYGGHWPDRTPLYEYNYTYYMVFRGLRVMTDEWMDQIGLTEEEKAGVEEIQEDDAVTDQIPDSESPEYKAFLAQFKNQQIKS